MPGHPWIELCPTCDRGTVGSTADDGCFWECGECGQHFDQDHLRNRAGTQAVPSTSPTYTADGNVEPDIPFEEPEEGDSLPQDEAGWHENLVLPEGFAWLSIPNGPGMGQLGINTLDPYYPRRIVALREWLVTNGLHAVPYDIRDRWVGPVYTRRPRTISVAPIDVPLLYTPGVNGLPDDFECPICGEQHDAYTELCPTTDRHLMCLSCSFGMDHRELTLHGEQLSCAECAHPCEVEGCESLTGGGRTYCDGHGEYASCGYCQSTMEALIGDPGTWGSGAGFDVLCDRCVELICPNCDRVSEEQRTFSADTGTYVCSRCATELLYGSNEESYDEDASLNAKKLRIPTIPGRENIRTCGVEIEGANGTGNASTLAQAFNSEGLSEYDEVMGYHHGVDESFAHVERDSSVDWEAVLGPFNPALQSDVTMLNTAVKTIRGMVHDGTLGLDLRAGLHIHVGAERVSLDGAYNLNTLFSYLEDVIFRLGAARWPIHRAVADRHYTQPIPKELRKLEFAREHGDEGSRYYALSFNNYFRQMLRRCECGASRYDSWEDCTCDLGKCTFEFRVFNTTANPRKLHAYLALTQALVAKALSLGKVTEPEVHFPVHSFEPARFKDMDEEQQATMRDAWSERLDWMFSELPLTDDEKQSIIYCIRHSELDAVGDANISELFPMEEVAEEVTA